MANDYLYTPLFGLELCVFGHSLTMSQREKGTSGHFSLKWMWVSSSTAACTNTTGQRCVSTASTHANTHLQEQTVSYWFTADSKHLSLIGELKLLVMSVLIYWISKFPDRVQLTSSQLGDGFFKLLIAFLIFILYLHAAEGQREWPSLSQLSPFICIPSSCAVWTQPLSWPLSDSLHKTRMFILAH